MTGAPAIRKFLAKIVLVGAVVFAIDRLLGLYLETAFYKQRHGDDQVSHYVIDQAREDILVLGGSRASHHYMPEVIGAAAGRSCYNGGRDNMDIIYESAVLEQCVNRGYVPKVVVLDMTHLDLANYGYGRELNIERTSAALLPFAHRHPLLYPTVSLAGKTEVLKAQLSHLYPYNSLIGSIIQNTYTHFGHAAVKGYEPLYQRLDSANYPRAQWSESIREQPTDIRSVQRLDMVIAMAKRHHIRLVGVFSPLYFPLDVQKLKSYRLLKQRFTKNGFEWYDFSQDQAFSMKPQLFNDDVHLNDQGAKLFSKRFAEVLSQW